MNKNTDIFSLFTLEGCQFYEELGSSPVGTLYSMFHPQFGSCVLKHFSASLVQKQNFLESMLLPLEKIKELEHPNIGKIYQWQTSKPAFLLRELVMGTSLQQLLKLKKNLEFSRSTQILLDISMGLLAGYPFGIVYKNLKPSNIIQIPDGTACLIDISLPPSDPHYIAPEQWEGHKSDVRSDIYAIGAIYYEMLTGTPLCVGNTKEEIKKFFLKNLDWKNLPNDTPPKIIDILKQTLERDPEKRYRSPVPLIGALREVLKEMGLPAKSMSFSTARLNTIEANQSQEPKQEPLATVATIEKRRGATTMMVAAVPSEQNVQDTANIDVDQTKTGNGGQLLRLHLDREAEEVDTGLDEIYITRDLMKKSPQQALDNITHIEKRKERKGSLPRRIVYFPKEFEYQVIEHLQKTFRRETWLLKESLNLDQLEVEINLEQAYILLHFYKYEDKLQKALQEDVVWEEEIEEIEDIPREEMDTLDIEAPEFIGRTKNPGQAKEAKTIDLPEEDIIEVVDGSEEDQGEASDSNSQDLEVETINDITIKTSVAISPGFVQKNQKSRRRFLDPELEVEVDFEDAYQTTGWVKFVREHNLKKGEHFDVCENTKEEGVQRFVIHLEKLENLEREQENITRIKEFFQADYEIAELDKGGMGAVLKLTAKNDPTFLSLRPENYWARERFKPYLKIVKDSHGKDIIYAEIPKGTEFVAKVAFEGHEESLIQEAQILSKIAEDTHVCRTIIGALQQGRLFARDDKSDQTRIGYYLMLEYAQQGNAEQLYHCFPMQRLSPTVAFALMYGMVQTLCRLKELGIIHRDIKPQNILLDSNGIPKLSDFGLAIITTQTSGKLTQERRRVLRIMDDEFMHITRLIEQTEAKVAERQKLKEQGNAPADIDLEIADLTQKIAELKNKEEERAEALKGKYRLLSAQENAMLGKFAGSLHYAAPEQLNPSVILTCKCDVYQLGAVMFTFLSGKKPVDGKSTFDLISKILYVVKPEVSDIVRGYPVVDALSNLIHRMMAHDTEERIDIEEVKEEMERILFDHALELKDLPTYEVPRAVNTPAKLEKWQSKVAFAQTLHKKSVDMIFSTIFQDQKLPNLRKDVRKIVFECRNCGKKLHVYRHMDGKKGTCPACGKKILILLAQDELASGNKE